VETGLEGYENYYPKKRNKIHIKTIMNIMQEGSLAILDGLKSRIFSF
jgi:hypothetical protein